MTQEEKQLLLKDLCARLPYHGLICQTNKGKGTLISVECSFGEDLVYVDFGRSEAEEFDLNDGDTVKPYLRPMSSMTEEEQEEFGNLVGLWKYNCGGSIRFVNHLPNLSGEFAKTLVSEIIIANAIDWLNKHHFDFRGLIEEGLALESPEDMYKIG